MRNRMRVLAGLAPVLFFGSNVLADTLEDVEKKIIEKMKPITGYECKVLSKQDMDAGGTKVKGEQDSTMKAMKKDGKWFARVESKSKMEMDMGGQTQKTDTTMLMINDDKFSYIYSENNGQKSAMKTSSQGGNNMMFDESMFKTMHENFNVKLLPDDSAGGKSCWVIEMTPKTPQPGMATTTAWYDKDSGFGVKTIGKDEAGKTVMEAIVSDVKLNQTYPADTFVFKCPDGVQMTDMTQAMSQTGEEAQPAADAKEEKKEEPAKEEPKAEKKDEKKKLKLPKLP